MVRYLAHIAQDNRRQTVSEHLNGTAELCAAFAAAFGAGEQGRLAGLAHDLGKYSAAFQRRLEGSAERVDHSTAGAAECCKLNLASAAFAVAGHHGGLPDGGGQGDHYEDKTFCGRMKKAALGKLEPYEAWRKEIRLTPAPPPAFSGWPEEMFFTRMLYSCLVDADFLDTETFMAGREQARGGGDPMEALEDRHSERGGFSGAGLGAADEITAFQHRRDSLGLNRGGLGVPQIVCRPEQLGQ